jgi:hypothetical protein
LAANNFNDAYAFLGTALAAFRKAHDLEASTKAVEDHAGRSWGPDKMDVDGEQSVDPEEEGAGDASEIEAGVVVTERGGSEGPTRQDRSVQRSVERESGEENPLRGSRSSELACVVEMEELNELLGQVKQAEAAFLLRHAQVRLVAFFHALFSALSYQAVQAAEGIQCMDLYVFYACSVSRPSLP